METRSKYLALATLLIVGLSACTRGGGPYYNPLMDPRYNAGLENDASVPDAAIPVDDGGLADVFIPVEDAGEEPVDAGDIIADASVPDAGIEDAGTPTEDAGQPVVDAGPPVQDAGTPEPDAGIQPCVDVPTTPTIDIEPDAPNTTSSLSLIIDKPANCTLEYDITWTYRYVDSSASLVAAAQRNKETVVASATRKHQVWTAEVFAKNAAGTASPTATSAVQILNARPSVTVTLPSSPTAESDLVMDYLMEDPDGNGCQGCDIVQRDTIQWTLNGDPQPNYLNRSSIPALALQPGQEWGVTVTVSDGEDISLPGSASTTVLNRAPLITDVLVVPSNPALPYPTKASSLMAYATASDPDNPNAGQAGLNTTWSWFKKNAGSNVEVPISGESGEVLASSFFSKGDMIKARAVISDGEFVAQGDSEWVEIRNDLPVITSVYLKPASSNGVTSEFFTSSEDIVCAHTSLPDADGDPVTLSYTWVINPDTPEERTSPVTGRTLAAGETQRYDTVQCTITPNDGIDFGTPMSGSGTADNAPPEVQGILSIQPVEPRQAAGKLTAKDTLVCGPPNIQDTDSNDSLDFTVRWTQRFWVNNPSTGQQEEYVTIHDKSSSSPNFAPPDLRRGDEIHCTVTPMDMVPGTGKKLSDGIPKDSAPVVIGNTPPTVDAVVILDPAPTSSDEVPCMASDADDYDNDEVHFEYSWYVLNPDEGGAYPEPDESGAYPVGTLMQKVGPTQTLQAGEIAMLPPTSAKHRQKLLCKAQPSDGTDAGAAVFSAPVMVGNTPPTANGARVDAIDPFTGQAGTPRADSTYVCSAIDVADIDDETLSYAVEWYVNDALVLASGFSDDGTLPEQYRKKNNRITCKVTVSDGTDIGPQSAMSIAVSIPDTVGSMTDIGFDPPEPNSSEDVRCAGTYDDPDEGDPQPVLTYRWLGESGNVLSTSEVLSKAEIARGLRIKCEVTASFSDPSMQDVVATSPLVTVTNGAPSLESVIIDQPSAHAYTPLSVQAGVATDPDQANISNFRWDWCKRPGGETSCMHLGTGASLDPDTLTEEERYRRGDTVRVTGFAIDDQGKESAGTSAEIPIGNAPPLPAHASFDPFSDESEETRPARHDQDLQCSVVINEDYGDDGNGNPTDFDGDRMRFRVEWAATDHRGTWPPDGFTGTQEGDKVWVAPEDEGVSYPFKTAELDGDSIDRHYLPANARTHCRITATDIPSVGTPESAPGVPNGILWNDGPWRFDVDTTDDEPLSGPTGPFLDCPTGSCSLRAALTLAEMVDLQKDPMGSIITIPGGTYTFGTNYTAAEVVDLQAPVEFHGDPEDRPVLLSNRVILRAGLAPGAPSTVFAPWGIKIYNFDFDCAGLEANDPPMLDVTDGIDITLENVKFGDCFRALRVYGGIVEARSIEVIGNPDSRHHAIEIGTNGQTKQSSGFIDGLSITGHGNRSNLSVGDEASALSVFQVTTFELSNATFDGNDSYSGGHILYKGEDDTPSRFHVRDSLLQNGYAKVNGGAIFMGAGGELIIENTEITNNTASVGAAVYAGNGAYAKTLTFIDSSIESNLATSYQAAGLYLKGASGTFLTKVNLQGTNIGGTSSDDCTTSNKSNRILPSGSVPNLAALQGGGIFAQYAVIENPEGSGNPSSIRCNKIYYGSSIATQGNGGGVNISSNGSVFDSNGIDVSGNLPNDTGSGGGACSYCD